VSSMPTTSCSSGGIRQLHDPAALQAQVARMIADPKSGALSENFAGQWLQLRNLNSIRPDPDKFPAWGPALREEMMSETRMFFDYILHENRPISDSSTAAIPFSTKVSPSITASPASPDRSSGGWT